MSTNVLVKFSQQHVSACISVCVCARSMRDADASAACLETLKASNLERVALLQSSFDVSVVSGLPCRSQVPSAWGSNTSANLQTCDSSEESARTKIGTHETH